MHMVQSDMNVVGIGLCWRVISAGQARGEFGARKWPVAEFIKDRATRPLGQEAVCVIGFDTFFLVASFGWHGLLAHLPASPAPGSDVFAGVVWSHSNYKVMNSLLLVRGYLTLSKQC